jgi:Smg protein
MMDLFSLIADQVRNKQELFDNEGKIMQALLNSGFRIQEADAALTLMQVLVKQQAESFFINKPKTTSLRMRAMNTEERERFTVDAFGFVTKLASLGIITEDQREDLLEKAMTTYSERIELDHIKNLIAYTHDRDNNSSDSFRRMRNTAWN